MQGFRKNKDFEVTDTAEADFDFGNAGSVGVHSQLHDPIRQLLLGEARTRPQSRLADARADDVLAGGLKRLIGDFHNERNYAQTVAAIVRKREQLLSIEVRCGDDMLPLTGKPVGFTAE